MIPCRPSVTITGRADGRGCELEATQWLPARLDEVFTFFQDPHNLERITPPYLHFHVRRSSTPAVAEHTRLWYRLSLHGVPIWWRTRIDAWNPPHGFVDVQERGPYRRWHHTHKFVASNGGTRMRDIVHYELWLHAQMPRFVSQWVRDDVRGIFEYRQRAIAEVFGEQAAAPAMSAADASAGEGPRGVTRF